VRRGEQWLVAGGNGAGKSTLGALLGRHSSQVDWLLARCLVASGEQCDRQGGEQGGGQGGAAAAAAAAAADEKASDRNELLEGSLALVGGELGVAGGGDGVGWVSTELHLRMASSSLLGGEVLRAGAPPAGMAEAVARWLGVQATLGRPFRSLSQGEQKLLLLGAALGARPALLVLDEVCQGLDAANRQRMLGLLQAVGAVSGCSLVYITHHPDEWLPCLTHVLHLREGAATYVSTRSNYNNVVASGQWSIVF